MTYICDEAEANDIVTAAYEDAWRCFSDINRDAARSWLYTNVRRKCINWLRHQQHHRRYASLHIQLCKDISYDPDPVEAEERQRHIERTLASLPENTRQIFTRCYVDGMKYREVAEELDISIETVKKHIVRALRLIKEYRNNVKK